MAVTVKSLVPAKQLEALQTAQYTANSVKAIIDTATATNTSGVNRTLAVNLVASGGSAGDSNLFIDTKTIAPGQTYRCPELIGQVLEPGGFISTLADAATSITFAVSGREIS